MKSRLDNIKKKKIYFPCGTSLSDTFLGNFYLVVLIQPAQYLEKLM